MDYRNGMYSIPATQMPAFPDNPNMEALYGQHGNQWQRPFRPLQPPQMSPVTSDVERAFFHPEKFEVVIDARGFEPKALRVNVTCDQVDVMAIQYPPGMQMNGTRPRSYAMTRNYQLPKRVIPTYAACSLTADGYLVISCPWAIQSD